MVLLPIPKIALPGMRTTQFKERKPFRCNRAKLVGNPTIYCPNQVTFESEGGTINHDIRQQVLTGTVPGKPEPMTTLQKSQ